MKTKLFFYRILFLINNPFKSLLRIIRIRNNLSEIDKGSFLKFVPGVSIIVEAGAADGVDTLEFCQRFPESRIYAIEPVIGQFDFLQSKFSKFKNVSMFNLALDSKSGFSKIYVGSTHGFLQGNGSSSLLKPTEHKKIFPEINFSTEQNVTTKSLVDFCAENNLDRIDVLWLDLQGKEFEVIQGSENYIRNCVRLIHTELTRIRLYEGMKVEKELDRYLKSIGFKCAIDAVGAISGNRLYSNNQL